MGILTNRPPGVSLETALAAWLTTLTASWLNKTLTSPLITSPTITTPKIPDSILDTNGNTILQLASVASATSYFQVGNSAGATVSLKAAGTGSNISANFQARGSSGLVRLVDGNGVAILSTKVAVASAVNYVTVGGAATGNGPTVGADGTDTNVDLNLAGKGTGIVKTGGNPVGVKVSVPASATATGVQGQWAADASWHYVCISANTWARSALATW